MENAVNDDTTPVENSDTSEITTLPEPEPDSFSADLVDCINFQSNDHKTAEENPREGDPAITRESEILEIKLDAMNVTEEAVRDSTEMNDVEPFTSDFKFIAEDFAVTASVGDNGIATESNTSGEEKKDASATKNVCADDSQVKDATRASHVAYSFVDDSAEEDEEDNEPYTLSWESGPLGLVLKPNSQGHVEIRRISRKGNAMGLQFARVGDVLTEVNGENVANCASSVILTKLKEVKFPIQLKFCPTAVTDTISSSDCSPSNMSATALRNGSMLLEPAAASEDTQVNSNPQEPAQDYEYDVVWEFGSLGCGFKQKNDEVRVISANPSQQTESVMQISVGDRLTIINGLRTKLIGFKTTIYMLQHAPKPVFLRFTRTIYGSADSLSCSSKTSAPQVTSNEYEVLWIDGSLGIQVKASAQGSVFVSKITDPSGKSPISDNIAVNDTLIQVGDTVIGNMGKDAAFKILRNVAKPVKLVFRHPIEAEDESKASEVATQREAHIEVNAEIETEMKVPLKPADDTANTISAERNGFEYSAKDMIEQKCETESARVAACDSRLPSQDPKHEAVEVASKSNANASEVIDSSIMARLPDYAEVASGQLNVVEVSDARPPPTYEDVFSSSQDHNVHYDRLRKEYVAADKKRNARSMDEPQMLPPSTSADHENTGDVCDPQTSVAPPQIFVRWTSGPLGITFKRIEGKIVVSRLTGHGTSAGINQLRPGDWLYTINEQKTQLLRLSETMEMLRMALKPVELHFVLL